MTERGEVIVWRTDATNPTRGYGFIRPEYSSGSDRASNVYFNSYAARFTPKRGDKVAFEFRDARPGDDDRGPRAWKVELDD